MFYHSMNPIIFQIGSLSVRWYGLMYVLGFLFVYFFARRSIRERKLNISDNEFEWFMLALLAGMVIGARLFEVLFYNPSYYLANPARVLAIWQGGLSFHGGLVALLLIGWGFCRMKKIHFLELADIFVMPLAFALALGRLGNFINGELYGRITNVRWCFYFPGADGCRHPSQLYEIAKNLVIFGVLLGVRKKQWPKGSFLGLFLLLYGVLRFLIEFVREPTVMVGPLTMGQFLNVFMIIGGIYLLRKVIGRKK